MKILRAEGDGLAKMPFYRLFERKLQLSQEKYALMQQSDTSKKELFELRSEWANEATNGEWGSGHVEFAHRTDQIEILNGWFGIEN